MNAFTLDNPVFMAYVIAASLAILKMIGRQLEPIEYVERARRMHRNEGENTPIFLVAGLLFVARAWRTRMPI